MKRHLIVNVIVCVGFALLDPILNWCCEWANMYSLGAEMILGMTIPALLVLFVIFAICSICVSLYNCIREKDVKYIVPLFVLILFISVYFVTVDQENLWMSILEYYR